MGGNNVFFSDVVNDCIYRFKGFLSGNCQSTLQKSKDAIKNDLGPAVKDALTAFMERRLHPDVRIFVTGYAKFFNDKTTQCSEVSWNYWQNDPKTGSGDKMNTKLREDLNKMVDEVNKKLEEVVASFRDARIEFINYDQKFNTHRFCEERFVEPQRSGEDRLDLFMHQYYTPDGQLQDDGDVDVGYTEWTKDWSDGMSKFVQENPGAKVAAPYDEHPIDINAFPRIPSGVMKVFHPTQKGHFAIADAVWHAYTHESAIQPPSSDPAWMALDKSQPVGDSGQRVGANFPRTWALLDGPFDARNIFYRMRDQACQGLCEQVAGIPGDLLAHKVQGKDGCEFATKIGGGKEMYFFASHAGQNCYDATEKMINEKLSDSDNPIYTAAWLNGPNASKYLCLNSKSLCFLNLMSDGNNPDEFYQAGIRDVNSDNPDTHPDLDTDNSHHLGHVHVACKRSMNLFSDTYEVYISGWDDGNWGKSILDKVRSCNLSPSDWKYESKNDHTFADGTTSQSWAKWNMVISNGGCAESQVEAAMGLRGGGLDCNFDQWFELNMFQ